MANVDLGSMAGPEATAGADNVQRARQAETARYAGLAQAYASQVTSTFVAENPELMKTYRYATSESGAGIQQQADAIQRSGLAEFLAAEHEAAQPALITSDWPERYGH
jgi:hypothetical protein